METINLKNVPKWLHNGEFYQNLEDKHGYVEVKKKSTYELKPINSLRRFKKIFSTCNFWLIDYPKDLFLYASKNEDEVLDYLYSIYDEVPAKQLIHEILDYDLKFDLMQYNPSVNGDKLFFYIKIVLLKNLKPVGIMNIAVNAWGDENKYSLHKDENTFTIRNYKFFEVQIKKNEIIISRGDEESYILIVPINKRNSKKIKKVLDDFCENFKTIFDARKKYIKE